jgi:hypothetical protein
MSNTKTLFNLSELLSSSLSLGEVNNIGLGNPGNCDVQSLTPEEVIHLEGSSNFSITPLMKETLGHLYFVRARYILSSGLL